MALSLPAHEDINLNNIPASALNVSSRMKLAWFLNPEQSLRSNQGLARDYRGLAEQMGFQYNDIKNFERSDEPTLKILEAWSGQANSTIGHLITYLEKMDRYDVIEDTVAQFKTDALSYLRVTKRLYESPIQVPEVTSYPTSHVENSGALTITDIETGGCSHYDAYVCYAEEDTDFVQSLAKYLEERGLVLFIKGRDLLAGTSEPDAHTQLLNKRCKFVLIILSPSFLRSPECEWQINFAAGLAVEHRARKLIPVLIKPCEIPAILKFVSKIDFTKPAQDWILDKLVQSLRATGPSIFVSSQGSLPPSRCQPELCNHNDSTPIISYPPSANYSQISSSSIPSALEITSVPITSQLTSTSLQVIPASPAHARTPPQTKHKFYQYIKDKFSLNSTSSSQPSTSSTATSGFHSHSGFESENCSDNKKPNDFCEETV